VPEGTRPAASAGSSLVKTTGASARRPKAEHHLHVDKAPASLRTYSSVVLGARMGYPLRRGTNED
jgi:hypothetical protein